MGFLDDIQQQIHLARESRDLITPEPVQRIDTLVADPLSGERRHRTDYAGTVWYGGRPQLGHPLSGMGAQLTTPFWLPDSHMYEPTAAATAQVQATAAIQGARASSTGSDFQIVEVGAGLAEDPRGTGALLVFMGVMANATLPLGVSYRVTVVCAVDGVRRGA